MKRLLAALLAVITMCSVTIGAYADDSPLAASDRVTTQLADIQKRREEIEKTIAQREAAKKAAIYGGRNLQDKDNLSYFINRKILTKKEFEAFKWSFIFSQFAVPLEDSLLDVFSQEAFQEMINQNFNITGVKEYIITDSTDTTAGNHTDQYAMLQDTNVDELVETIKDNYAIYPIFDKNDNQPTLETILNPSALYIFDQFYLYDTLADKYAGVSKDNANALFYNQDLLSEVSGVKITETKVPVFVYDANTYLYLQLAVGAYLKANGNKSIRELVADRGGEALCIDSYGNICSVARDGRATILLPNFGNSFLNARYEKDNSKVGDSLEESINLYNKWFVTLYSRTTRNTNKIYPDIPKLEYLDNVSKENTESGGTKLCGDNNPRSHYKDYIRVIDNGKLNDTIVLVETGAACVLPSDSILAAFHKIINDQDLQTTSWTIGLRVRYSHYTDAQILKINNKRPAHTVDLIAEANKEGDTSSKYSNVAANLINSLYYTYKVHRLSKDAIAIKNQSYDMLGMYRSPYNYNIQRYAPFTASHLASADTDSIDYYTLKQPIIEVGIDVFRTNTLNAANQTAEYTHFFHFSNSLLQGDWRILDATYHSSTTHKDENKSTAVIGTDDILTLLTTFSSDQIIDNRFANCSFSLGAGISQTEVYIPKNIVDVGQDMSAYMNTEKGMFLAKYNLFYSGTFEDLCNSAIYNSNNFFRRNVAKFYTRVNDKVGVVNLSASAETNNLTSYDIIYTYSKGGIENISKYLTGDTVSGTSSNTDYCSKIYVYGGHDDSKQDKFTVVLNQYNDSTSRTQEFQRFIYMPWSFVITDSTFSQDMLSKLYSFQEKWKQDKNPDSNNEKDPYHPIQKIDAYVKVPLKDGVLDYDAKTIVSERGTDTDAEYIAITPLYYYEGYSGLASHTLNGNKPSFNSLKDILKDMSYEDLMSLNYDKLTTITRRNFKAASIANTEEDIKFLADVGVGFADLITQAVRTWHFAITYPKESCAKNFGLDIDQLMQEFVELMGIDPYDLLISYMCLFSALNMDSAVNCEPNRYYYDEYLFTLRNPTDLSNEMGCNTKNDFPTVTYFWDRHYLLQSAFNRQVLDEVDYNWGGGSKSMKEIYEGYMNEIDKNYFSTAELPLKNFVEQGSYKLNSSAISSVYTPYYYEWSIQDRDQSPEASLQDQIDNAKNKTNASIESIFGSNSAFYNYLDSDTIILYPFSRLSTETSKSLLKLKAGIGDAVIAYAESTSSLRKGSHAETSISTRTDLVAMVMALQCNTNFYRNHLAVTPAKAAATTHVTKEELMDNANQFFTNPVSSISYIFTGFLYQIHATIATGNIGSVFSINWLLESDVYKWIMNRYIAILAIAVGVILLLKLIQFAMNHSKDIASIGRSVVGILAMCLVPVVIFNSFVWAFNTSSKWFLHGSLDKMLLSQIDVKERERINNDPGVTAELNAFKEQFNALDLNGYDCITFEQMSGYSLENGPSYTNVGIWEYMNNVVYSKAYGNNWYSTNFEPIHGDLYGRSIFYFFYDYIRAEYFNYCSNIGSGGNAASVKNLVQSIRDAKNLYTTDANKSVVTINTLEQEFAMQVGGFRTMLEDTTYVYGDSILEENKPVTGGPKAKDLVGLYVIFNNNNAADLGTDKVASSPYYKAWENSKLITATDDIVPKKWNQQEYLAEYFQDINANTTYKRGKASGDKYYIITSYLDLFHKSYNDTSGMSSTDPLTINDFAVTPLEEKLCAVTDDIYNTTLKALNYLPKQIHDESAITLMAMIATCKINEAFGVAPAEPILESVTLDSFVRTAFLTKLEEVGSNVNTLYAMIAQGDSIGKVLVVVFLELIICVASVARILIILYITVAAFVILGLRLLHKAPRTTDLVYGIVGNMMALLALHAITLFLVIIAVEAVAGAVSVVPSLLLDILMIAFTIMMGVMLFKLVKNIAKDAINIGGAKIKGMVHAVGDTVLKAVRTVTHSDDSDMNAQSVTVNTSDTTMTPEEQSEELVERRRPRVTAIVDSIQRVEAEEAEEAKEARDAESEESNENKERQDSQVERNVEAERQLSDE